MARYTGSVCRQCRREGTKLFLKGDRCHSGKCAMERYPVAPGMHGTSRRKPSGYSVQLREKQKVKRIYGVLETQFRRYFEKAANMKGATGENMLQLLERRLDNVVYRLGMADSRAQARQLVNHGHFAVNGKRVDIPSYSVSANDVISVRENHTDIEMFKKLREGTNHIVPGWLEFDAANLSGKVVELPKRSDIDMSIDELLIVELYSK